jgi:uncharacterized coiled-coil protein SlyX
MRAVEHARARDRQKAATIRSAMGDDADGPAGLSMRGRIEELEVHAAFQARTIEELDEVVRDFAMRVDRLERELRELRGLLEASGTVSPSVHEDDLADAIGDDAGALGDERDAS